MGTFGTAELSVVNAGKLWQSIDTQAETIRKFRTLNEHQAARIMELELYLSCLRRVGDGVHVDHSRLMELYRFYDDQKGRGMLSRSKFARK